MLDIALATASFPRSLFDRNTKRVGPVYVNDTMLITNCVSFGNYHLWKLVDAPAMEIPEKQDEDKEQKHGKQNP